MDDSDIRESLSKLINDIALHTNTRYDDDVRAWLMGATLRIWAGNRMFADAYVPALEALNGETYSTAQVITAMGCAGEKSREMDVPLFFREIVERDAEKRTSHSRAIVDAMSRFLAEMASINGDFTLAEARALREICDLLHGYCDDQLVPTGKRREHHPEMITPLSKTGYVQVTPEKEQQTPPVPQEKNPTPAPKQEEDEPTITITLTLEPEFLSESNSEQEMTGVTKSKPNEAKDKQGEKAEMSDTLESVLAELNGLVGLDKVKNDVQSLLNFIKIRQMRTQRGMKTPTISYHLVFTGNPGTGKTTVARMVAKLYYFMGILPQGQLVETDRSGLVAGYLGQTAIKTQKVIQEALGGVLFIDEAYSLANDKEDSYGKEAIETILKAMEDHRDELVVIVAGYDELMHDFIDSNPGLRSRFNKYFHFPDYDGDDLLRILQRFCETNGYALAQDTIPPLKEKLREMYENREEHFGNARAIRNLFEHAINHQANRLVLDSCITDQELAELTLEDILSALEAV